MLCNVLPLNLRLQEVLIQEYIRITRKPSDDLLKALLIQLMNCPVHLDHRIITPVHMLKMAIRRTLKTDVNLSVEPLPRHTLQDLFLTPPNVVPVVTDYVGNSKNRSVEQADWATEVVRKFLTTLPSLCVIAFTDGSALTNPGPCGASAIIYYGGMNNQPVIVKTPISACSTSYHGELHGILSALVSLPPGRSNIKSFHIFSDCQSAISSLVGSNLSSHCETILLIRRKISLLIESGIKVNLTWVGGHTGLLPNELADRTAAEEAFQQNLDVTLSYPEAKSFVRKAINNQWQKLWNRANVGRHLHHYRPSVTSKSYRSFHSKSGESKLNRVLLGHTRLKSHLQNIGIEDNNSCDCGKGIEDIEHVLFQCQLYSNQRDILESTVYSIYHRYNIGFHLQRFGIYSLLAPDTSIPLRAKDEITAAVISFWSTAGCNI